ncbi:MAG: FMN-binding protein [Acidobacteria bacterium]|nr:FMN-binding protein [Acidobacteriota bacterium]
MSVRRWLSAAALLILATAAFAVGYVRTSAARASFGTTPRPLGVYRDGTYEGWGIGYHGRIRATVVIRRGRIESTTISTCRMRYPCSMIAGLPDQVIARQGPEVDIVSGATDSALVFSAAVEQALDRASRVSVR